MKCAVEVASNRRYDIVYQRLSKSVTCLYPVSCILVRGRASTYPNMCFSPILSRMTKLEQNIMRKLGHGYKRTNVNTGTGFPALRDIPVARGILLWLWL